MARRIKAFIIAACSMFWIVAFKRKNTVRLGFNRNRHKFLFGLLDLVFDVRVRHNGEVFLNLKQKRKANYERGI
jgi:hypothetical protein